MKRHFSLVAVALVVALLSVSAQGLDTLRIFSVTANPAADASSAMRISWGCDTATTDVQLLVAKASDKKWKKAAAVPYQVEFCTCYDSVYSRAAGGANFYEDARFNKFGAEVSALSPDTRYRYKIVAKASDGSTVESPDHFFRTAGSGKWRACIISDYHCYPPLNDRLVAAMQMVDAVRSFKPFDWVLNLGDVCAWGGSYSFWTYMYKEQPFTDYMWAGVNGNHDNMTRTYGLSGDFFKNANYVPRNGYEGQEGVVYWFKYNDALFVMLNNEKMSSPADFEKALSWVEKVLAEQGSAVRYKIVCEHYQWFFGGNGDTSQYGRWHETFERCGVDLALAGNNHYYVRAHSNGVVYVQTPSSDNERGQGPLKELEHNADKIDFRWNEGAHTVGAMHMEVSPKCIKLNLLDRYGRVIDSVTVPAKK